MVKHCDNIKYLNSAWWEEKKHVTKKTCLFA